MSPLSDHARCPGVIRLRVGGEDLAVRDCARLRAALRLMREIDRAMDSGSVTLRRSTIRSLAGALHCFFGRLLGPEASEEVVRGMVHVALMHLVRRVRGRS
ncbi:hypothetical protein JXA47_00610 [Candidatus Sumerlaeota bacterium]|nr:hypothetical protein [Candidatus Sumerlaeota bacterium]